MARLRSAPWRALARVAAALDAPLAAVLGGEAAERAVDRFLRSRRDLAGPERAAVAEAIFGVALWRRRLGAHLGRGDAAPRWLLASLVRDLGGVADAERLVGLEVGVLPAPRPVPERLALRFSLPDWLEEAVLREAGPEAAALADALNLPGPVCLRPNARRVTGEELAERLRRDAIETRPGRLAPGARVVTSPRANLYGSAAWRDGLFEVQDEASQLVGALADPRPGDEVLDLCAGAGGKTLQLAAFPGVRVHAADPAGERLERLRRRAARAGARVAVHGAEPPPELVVDRVLVDAPCSELGALRRGPDLRFRLDPARFAALPAAQLAILSRAARHVRRGGRLVYATCTFRREEDEEVAAAFEAAHPGFRRARPAAPDEVVGADGFLRTWPHRHDADAFFAAVWDRDR